MMAEVWNNGDASIGNVARVLFAHRHWRCDLDAFVIRDRIAGSFISRTALIVAAVLMVPGLPSDGDWRLPVPRRYRFAPLLRIRKSASTRAAQQTSSPWLDWVCWSSDSSLRDPITFRHRVRVASPAICARGGRGPNTAVGDWNPKRMGPRYLDFAAGAQVMLPMNILRPLWQ
jgi:hypothetical protein